MDGADGHRVAVAALVAHDAHRAHRQQHSKRLPQFLVEARSADFLLYDGVGPAHHLQPLRGDLAHHSHRQAGAGEGLPQEDFLRQAEFPPDHPHLILEQLPQGLDQFEFHLRRQAAHVVVGLDGGRGAAHRDRFNHVGVERALHQELHLAQLVGLLLKDADEEVADAPALFFRVLDAAQLLQEGGGGIHAHHCQTQAFAHQRERGGELIAAQQAVVHKDAGQALPQRTIDQRGRHG